MNLFILINILIKFMLPLSSYRKSEKKFNIYEIKYFSNCLGVLRSFF